VPGEVKVGDVIDIPERDRLGGPAGVLRLKVSEVPDVSHPKLEWVLIEGRPVVDGKLVAEPTRMVVRAVLLRELARAAAA
jgi:hypothetical protein